MSLLKKLKKAVTKGAKYLPALAAAAPNSKALANAAQGLQMGSTIATALTGGGIPGIATLQAGNMPTGLPAFPGMPAAGGASGGIVKTGLPVLAAAGGALVRAAPAVAGAVARNLPKVSRTVMKALGYIGVGSLVYDAAGNLVGERHRRHMNPLNPKAAKRAIRRVKAVRKLCHKIESSLPKQKSRAACHSHPHRHR